MIRRIALWAHPRSLSTAFERIFVERNDSTVVHEPFSYPFFFGPERGHARFAEEPTQPSQTFDRVTKTLVGPTSTPILFFKDLAFHISGRTSPAFLSKFTNTFILRRPDEALASFYAKLPDFDWLEAGYEALLNLYHCVSEVSEKSPVVVEAAALQQDPNAVVESYCQDIGIPFLPESLQWEPRPIKLFGSWEGWHDEAQYSRGIEPPRNKRSIDLPPRIQAMVDRAWPYYHEMLALGSTAGVQ